MYYKDYQNLRDASWKILLDCGINRLPVDIDMICRRLGVRVLSYDVGAELIERGHLSGQRVKGIHRKKPCQVVTHLTGQREIEADKSIPSFDYITPELEHRKSGYVERKRRPYQGNVVRIA